VGFAGLFGLEGPAVQDYAAQKRPRNTGVSSAHSSSQIGEGLVDQLTEAFRRFAIKLD
jgi:hypothetical protein